MKKLLFITLLIGLSGCAAQRPSDAQLMRQALHQYTQIADIAPDQKGIDMLAFKIRSHGALGDTLATAAGGGATALQLRNALRDTYAAGERGFLIIGAGGALDRAMLGTAFDGQALSGMQIFYAGDGDAVDRIRRIVEETGAAFHLVATR